MSMHLIPWHAFFVLVLIGVSILLALLVLVALDWGRS